MPAKITFLGVGGGRFVIINQIRASGGWILEMDGEMIHVDPGPGALVRAKQYGVKLGKLTGVIVSHAHPDHCADAEMVIEAMTVGARKKRGFIIGDKTVFEGAENFHPVVSKYHMNAAEKYYMMKQDDKVNPCGGKVEIKAVPTAHGEPDGLGFVFRGSSVLGFTGDGDFFPDQQKYFNGCDYLLVNCLRPKDKTWPKHMNAEGARKLIDRVKPKLAILQHFGITMLKGVAEREAKWITRNTGVKTVVARDGQVLELDGKGETGEAKEKKAAGLGKFMK